MKVFVNDPITMDLNSGKDLSSYTIFRIKYEDPDGDRGRWAAIISPANNNYVRGTILFNQEGPWRIQAYADGVAIGPCHGMYTDVRVYEALSTTTTLAPTTFPPTT